MQKLIILLAAALGWMARPALGQTELIINGGFESSPASIAPWQVQAAPNPALNVLASIGAYGGSSQCLLLGNGNSYSQDVYQTITFPSNLISATLSFYYNVVTTDLNNSIDATLYIQLKDANQNILDQNTEPVSNQTYTGGYRQFSARIASGSGSIYAGKTVTFHFVAATANVFAAYTQFYLDNVSLQIATTADIPANDNFTNRLVIPGSAASLLADNTYASKETGETAHAGNAGGHSIWWGWVAPSNGIVAIKAIGTAFQPLLAAYTGNAVNLLTPIASNNGSPAQISFKAVAGTQYAIAVDGYNGAAGGVRLTLGFASDVTPPTVTITAPAIGANLTNPFVQVKGVASDTLAVAQVQYRLENLAGTNEYQAAIGTNNWSATVNDLVPGYNLVRVRAIDTSSNFSVGVTRTFNYLVGSPVTLSISGRGRITGATNGQSLNLGNIYNLTATPATGFAFTAWTGNYFSHSPALAFMMHSNLTLQANFTDVARPTLAITNIPLAGNISNELFVVKGKAGDNLAVSNVCYNLNHFGWLMAATTNSWTNWSASLNLIPGSNVLSAYAMDTTGNASLTNTVKLVYVLSAQLTVNTNGKGSINPVLNGALLQIGKNYTLTAAPAVGFGFTNWTDGTGTVATNKPVLTFQMASNLSFTANFIDTARPTLAITNILAIKIVSNQLFTVRGKAGDNLAVTNVFYNLNHFGWLGANTTNNWPSWYADLGLTPGTNVVSAYAVDSTGNCSLTNTVKLVYILSATLSVSINGKGVITPAANGALLQIGRNYTLTATPGLGFVFTNWTDGSSAIVTNKPALTFQMASNLAFTANFVDVMKPTLLITNVAAGQRWSNSLFTVKGRAADNLAVTNVFYNLNGLGWTALNLENGQTNWSAPLELTPGTNAVSAYAMDGAGNASITNTVKIFYVVSALVTVQTVGGGILTPNYNGQSLAIGNNYSMKATATNGFVFSYWSGDVPMTTNATLNFIMISNKTIIANFLDVMKPVVAITLPFADQKWSNVVINVSGTASDNLGVTEVWVQLNKGGWTNAATDNGFASWSTAGLTVIDETNLVEAYAVDAAGHVSVTKSVAFKGYFPNAGMGFIPGGTFTMGDPLGDYDQADIVDNVPTNILLSAFYMDMNLVSYAQWQSVYNWATSQGYGFSHPGAGKASNHPVHSVNWYDCVKWCNARSLKAGLTPVYFTDAGFTQTYTNRTTDAVYANWSASGYRLPTEAEWEMAARGGLSNQRFPWGDIIDWNLANFTSKPLALVAGGFAYDHTTSIDFDPDFNDGVKPYTSPVGTFLRNGYGLGDMAGNVREWCWDWYGKPYGQPTADNPAGPSAGIYRVWRGGSWNATANEARCAYRGSKLLPAFSDTAMGFRCVRR